MYLSLLIERMRILTNQQRHSSSSIYIEMNKISVLVELSILKNLKSIHSRIPISKNEMITLKKL